MLLLKLPSSATSETSLFSARDSCAKEARSAGRRRGRRWRRAWIERRSGWEIWVGVVVVVVVEEERSEESGGAADGSDGGGGVVR